MLTRTREGRILRLTLARAEKRNALSAALAGALVDALRGANADSAVGVILLDAEGSTFCSGMDLDDAPASDPWRLNQIHAELFAMRAVLVKPLVAAVSGSAFGGGLGLVANAHIAIASDEAQFGLTELRVGMWPFMIWPAISAAIGERRAIELALTTRVFGAADALAYGLVHDVVARSRTAARAEDVARQLAEASSETITRGLRAAANPSDASALRAEQLVSPDFREGVVAFREKRAPRWPSRE